MKQYVIDELRAGDYRKLKAYLDDHFNASIIEGIYHVPIKDEILTDVQTEHLACQPFYFALDLEPQRLVCELLIRTNNRIRCSCMGYATEHQRNWMIHLLDDIFHRLEIKT